MLYGTLLFIGIVGLAAQTVLGFMHTGDAHHGPNGHGSPASHGPHGHNGHSTHHGHAGQSVTIGNEATGHLHTGAHTGHGNAAKGGHTPLPSNGTVLKGKASAKIPWLTLFSPLTIFSLCFGAGLTGIAVRGTLSPLLTICAAVLGAMVFYGLIVQPLLNLVFRFAARPAETITGIVAKEAEAMGQFDAQGRGIVRAVVDGQVVRLLAHLEPEDRAKGVSILSGDKVVVTSVDTQKNTVRVTRL
jgi:translation initiation factor IF-1